MSESVYLTNSSFGLRHPNNVLYAEREQGQRDGLSEPSCVRVSEALDGVLPVAHYDGCLLSVEVDPLDRRGCWFFHGVHPKLGADRDSSFTVLMWKVVMFPD